MIIKLATAIDRRRTGESPEFPLVDNPDKPQRIATITGRNKVQQQDTDISTTATESIPLTVTGVPHIYQWYIMRYSRYFITII